MSVLAALALSGLGCEADNARAEADTDDGKARTSRSGKPASSAAEAKDGPEPSDGKIPGLKCGDDWPKTMAADKTTVLGCVVLDDVTIRGVDCLKLGRVEMHEGGAFSSCKIARDRTFSGVPCRGEYDVTFFESGALQQCAFARPFRTEEGILCRDRAVFYESGKLDNCRVAEETERGPHSGPPGTFIKLTKDGTLDYFTYPDGKPLAFDGRKCKEAHFYPGGAVSVCVLNEKMKIKGETTPLSVRLCFDDKGKPVSSIPGGWGCFDPAKIAALEAVVDAARDGMK